MSSAEAGRENYAGAVKLVIVCRPDDAAGISAVLDEHAPHGWRKEGQILLVEAEDHQMRMRPDKYGRQHPIRVSHRKRTRTNAALMAALPRGTVLHAGARIITVGWVHLDEPLQPPQFENQIDNVHDCRESIPAILAASNLDWRSRLLGLLAQYQVAYIDEPSLDLWIGQFRSAGVEWVGNALLKALDFWPAPRMLKALCTESGGGQNPSCDGSWMQRYARIAVGKVTKFESAGVVGRLFVKGVNTGTLFGHPPKPLVELLEELSTPQEILYLEDCLMTGQELIQMFKSLAPEKISRHKIDLHFAMGTEFGRARLQCYLQRRKLHSVRVLEPVGGFLPNLTPAALEAARNDNLFDENLIFSPLNDRPLRTGLSLALQGHYNAAQRKEILRFLSAVGEPLMRRYLLHKGKSAEMIEQWMPTWSLGAGGLGLLQVFAHGPSKPALPVLWLSGKVQVQILTPWTKQQPFDGDWHPLFPSKLSSTIGGKEHA